MSSYTNHPIRRAWRYAFDRGIIFVDAVTIFGGGLTTWYILRNNYNGPVLSLNSTLPILIYFTGILLLIGVLIGLGALALVFRFVAGKKTGRGANNPQDDIYPMW